MCLLPLASYNWLKSLKPLISKLIMCDLDWLSEIQSQIFAAICGFFLSVGTKLIIMLMQLSTA